MKKKKVSITKEDKKDRIIAFCKILAYMFFVSCFICLIDISNKLLIRFALFSIALAIILYIFPRVLLKKEVPAVRGGTIFKYEKNPKLFIFLTVVYLYVIGMLIFVIFLFRNDK